MVMLDPYSSGFQFALFVVIVFMILGSVVGWRFKRDLLGVLIGQALTGGISIVLFPSIAVAFG